MAASRSTAIVASWQLPPAADRNGNITGFKLFYKRKDPVCSPITTETIYDGAALSKNVTGLLKYTEYELQVLAFNSVGEGQRSPLKTERTLEDGKEHDISYIKPQMTKKQKKEIICVWTRTGLSTTI